MKFLPALLTFSLLFTGCGAEKSSEPKSASAEFMAMDTLIDITVYGEGSGGALDSCREKISAFEKIFSAEDEASELHALNLSGKAELSEELLEVITCAQRLFEDTGGAFNIALYPLKKAWGFSGGEHRVPGEEELAKLLALADPLAAKITGNNIEYTVKGMELDLGGIAKGYTANMLAELLLKDEGVSGALISLGGNVMTVGKKPDDTPWKIGIQDPAGEKPYIGVVSVEGKKRMSVVTSGGYERYFELDGVRYHHILDPTTGYPADNGIVSATIVSEDSELADVLSTAAFVMGPDGLAKFWREGAYDFEAVLLDEEGVMHVTEGLSESFSTECPLEIIHK